MKGYSDLQGALRSWILVASVGFAGILTACDTRQANEYASPEAAMYAMFDAFAYIGADPNGAWAFLGPDTRARLEALADEGPEGLRPTDYLRFGWLPDHALIRSIERTDGGGRYATLAIETELDERFEIEMIRVGKGWQVELGPVAMATPPQPSSDKRTNDDHAPTTDAEELE